MSLPKYSAEASLGPSRRTHHEKGGARGQAMFLVSSPKKLLIAAQRWSSFQRAG